jgi:hypothetical protein
MAAAQDCSTAISGRWSDLPGSSQADYRKDVDQDTFLWLHKRSTSRGPNALAYLRSGVCNLSGSRPPRWVCHRYIAWMRL